MFGQSSSSAAGVYGQSSSGYGVSGFSTSGTALKAQGNADVTGTLSKGGGTFLIDHPLDPENKFLRHSFMESPEMKNFYDGVEVADDAGEFAVQLPAYFDALNESIRYQLTAIGAAAPNLHIKTEMKGGRFTVAGASKGQKISWSVTGVRKDAFAKANPVIVEEEKPAEQKGKYRHPLVHGKSQEQGIEWEFLSKQREVADSIKVAPKKPDPTP